jgi:hypothetical protein
LLVCCTDMLPARPGHQHSRKASASGFSSHFHAPTSDQQSETSRTSSASSFFIALVLISENPAPPVPSRLRVPAFPFQSPVSATVPASSRKPQPQPRHRACIFYQLPQLPDLTRRTTVSIFSSCSNPDAPRGMLTNIPLPRLYSGLVWPDCVRSASR